ncbi:MAG: hypothetical protein QOK46_1512 [Microbacteriaceae bacterium]|jgi:uncharacterized protein YndB with AHSA1/START domain|nr:polyketide cyclase [Microbacteriaceae bacterium]MDQ1554434.1 hypothetical protein [Microbacteriaceae bacterium]
MEYGSIEREIYLEASPEVVFEVVSSSEHIAKWWSDEAEIETIGDEGHVLFRGDRADDNKIVPLMVIEARHPHRFSFRWDFTAGAVPGPDNSLLVTFDLEPVGNGTLVKMTESGFREQGWEAAVLEEKYLDHTHGWDYFIPRLGEYVAVLVSSS